MTSGNNQIEFFTQFSPCLISPTRLSCYRIFHSPKWWKVPTGEKERERPLPMLSWKIVKQTTFMTSRMNKCLFKAFTLQHHHLSGCCIICIERLNWCDWNSTPQATIMLIQKESTTNKEAKAIFNNEKWFDGITISKSRSSGWL